MINPATGARPGPPPFIARTLTTLENPKLRRLDEATARREKLRHNRQTIVLTNGCFDLLHSGHTYFLQEAARLGDALFIGINADASALPSKAQPGLCKDKPNAPTPTAHSPLSIPSSFFPRPGWTPK